MIVDYGTSIGDRIRFMRLSRNLTQDELAANLGISGRKVSEYEKGVSVPDSKVIETLCSFFKCELSYFISDGCLREECIAQTEFYIIDVCDGSADENGEFVCIEYVMVGKELREGNRTYIWRVNRDFSKEYNIPEGTNYLVSSTRALVHGDKILVVSGGKTYIARYEYIDGNKYITECKNNSKRRLLKKRDIICGRIRGIVKFEKQERM